MNNDIEAFYWEELRGKLKLRYPFLTSADLQWRHGCQDDILEMIALKLGISLKRLKDVILQLQ